MDFFSQIIVFIFVLIFLFFPLLKKFLEKKTERTIEMHKSKDEQPIPSKNRLPLSSQAPVEKRLAPYQTKGGLQQREFRSELDRFERKSVIENRTMKTQAQPKFKESVLSPVFVPEQKNRQPGSMKLKKLQLNRSLLKHMVILSELYGKPKAFRDD
jgi:hypothetical protein